MDNAMQFFTQHGYTVLFLTVLADQLGLPIPAAPVVLAAGALVQSGTLSVDVVLLISVMASLIGHTLWFVAGRRAGSRALRVVCQLTLEPDACVRRTQTMFGQVGPFGLMLARFVPGLDTVAQPLAGMSGMPWSRYLLLNVCGTLLWTGGLLMAGNLFGDELAVLAGMLLHLGASFMQIAGATLAVYLLWKLLQRQRFVQALRIARISVDELKKLIDAGEPVTIIDLRHQTERHHDHGALPGSLPMTIEEVSARQNEIPRDREVVVFCN